MLIELFAHKDYVRILHAVRRKSRRFGELQEELDLNPAQVDRALKFLRKGLLIVPKVVPSEKGRLLVEYEIGKRGSAVLDLFRTFRADAVRKRGELGEAVAAELESFTH